jgi:hypothetical protein
MYGFFETEFGVRMLIGAGEAAGRRRRWRPRGAFEGSDGIAVAGGRSRHFTFGDRPGRGPPRAVRNAASHYYLNELQ